MNYHIGRDLDVNSPRTLAVLHPLRLVITNLPEAHLEMVHAKVSHATMNSTAAGTIVAVQHNKALTLLQCCN